MLVRHRARENRPTLAGRRVVEAAGLEPASASAPSARFYERSSRSSFACLDGPGRRQGASPFGVPPVPRARSRKVSPLNDTGNRAVGRPDRCSLAVFRQQREARLCRRVLLLPAFYESPANSARLAGRGPLTSKPVRPHPTYSNILQVIIKRSGFSQRLRRSFMARSISRSAVRRAISRRLSYCFLRLATASSSLMLPFLS
jgi:hypothetical protein